MRTPARPSWAVLWCPALPLVNVLFGRFWCAVCPFAALSDFVQKLVGVNRPVPPFLKKYGIWIIDATFLAITWADHVFGIVGSPWGSGRRRTTSRASGSWVEDCCARSGGASVAFVFELVLQPCPDPALHVAAEGPDQRPK
jgi:hypothetical protein